MLNSVTRRGPNVVLIQKCQNHVFPAINVDSGERSRRKILKKIPKVPVSRINRSCQFQKFSSKLSWMGKYKYSENSPTNSSRKSANGRWFYGLPIIRMNKKLSAFTHFWYCFTIGVRSWARKWTFSTLWSTLNTKTAFSEFHIYICTDFVIRTSLSVFDRLSWNLDIMCKYWWNCSKWNLVKIGWVVFQIHRIEVGKICCRINSRLLRIGDWNVPYRFVRMYTI